MAMGRKYRLCRHPAPPWHLREEMLPDRKSTRLNSSHLVISYAVFCLKKKKLVVCCDTLAATAFGGAYRVGAILVLDSTACVHAWYVQGPPRARLGVRRCTSARMIWSV